MKIQPLQQPTRAAHPANQRRWRWLGLGLIAIVTVLSLSFYAMVARAPQARPVQPVVVQSAAIDPAAQGVNGYIQAHANVDKAPAIDPAAQSVNDYLRAHAIASQPVAIDAATQGVLGYLKAHRAVEKGEPQR
jgi:hypothetical protein